MKRIPFFVLLILITSCSKTTKNHILKGQIQGLQKGMVYLQHIQDTAYVTLDSMHIYGESDFELSCDLLEPEILFLSVSTKKNAPRIKYFAERGQTTITTRLKRFLYDAKINGGQQQQLLESYYKNIARFKEENLDLLEAQFNAKKDGDDESVDALQTEIDELLKRRYLYTVNFALYQNDNEVAPYITLSEIYDANITYLDTIQQSLTEPIKASKYGLILKDLISELQVNN